MNEDYAGLLKALREAPDESTESISIDRAIHDGRRTIRRRRVLGTLGVVGVVAAASSARPLFNAFREPPVAGPPPGRFQPLQIWGREFDVGTAGGFQPYQYITGRIFHMVALTSTARPTNEATAVATLYAPGLRSAPLSAALQLEPIEGRPVYVVGEDSGATTITWEYADHCWGTVAVYTDPAGRAARARHVAESIHRRKTPVPLTVPFTVPRRLFGPEDDVVLVRVPYGALDSEYEVAVAAADPEEPTVVSSLTSAGIHRPAASEKPNTTIAGRPAIVDGGLNATVFGVGSGYAADAMADAPLDAKAIAAAVTLAGGKGTDEPLR
ncbi:hypothetical protein GCM10009745_22940 [Kribbella yunnanensis]|uniref:Twin-arginine translocation signal domain-containing protein n=1 Tax=Kribbella yunnanensis TaxID=190194 RepID=A0ABN2GYM5_9ACTN